jgi:hypothetical protein
MRFRWLVPFVAIACGACGSRAQPTPAPTSAPTAASADVLSDARAIVQARVGLAARGTTPGTWIDFEVAGPGSTAMRVCKALLTREQALQLPPEIEVVVLRPCSGDALAEPEAMGAYALVQLDRPGAIELMTITGDAPKDDLSHVSIRRRTLIAFADEPACNAMLEKMKSEARGQGGDAVEWLNAQIERQKREVETACTVATSEKCKQSKQLLDLLEKKKTETEQQKPDGVSAFCRRRS